MCAITALQPPFTGEEQKRTGSTIVKSQVYVEDKHTHVQLQVFWFPAPQTSQLEVFDHPGSSREGRVKAGQVSCGGTVTQYGWVQSAAGLLDLEWSQKSASFGLGVLGKDHELSSSEPIRRGGLIRTPGLPRGAGRGIHSGSFKQFSCGSCEAEGSGGALGGRAVGSRVLSTSSRHCTGTVEAAETDILRIYYTSQKLLQLPD